MDITTRYPSHESCQKKRYQTRKSCLIYNTSQITSCLRYRTTIRFVFFIHSLWSVGTTLISDTTQNPELSGFQLRMRIKTKPNGKQKLSKDRIKLHFCGLLNSLLVVFVYSWKHSVVLFCNTDKITSGQWLKPKSFMNFLSISLLKPSRYPEPKLTILGLYKASFFY